MSSTRELWFRRFHESAVDEIRLVCFPHAGGAASSFYQLSEGISGKLEVWSVQYPGRQDRRHEPLVPDLLELVRQISDVIGTLGDRPLALFGHSMGAVIAFEVARRLERNGTPPVALFVSGRRAPSIHRDEKVHQRDDAGLVAEIKALNGTDNRLLLDDDVLQMVLPAIRADYQAIETYRYRPDHPIRVPIIALAGRDDPRAGREAVEAWAGHTTGGFSLHVLPGGHFFINGQRQEVARIVVDALTGVAAKLRSATS